MSKKVPDLLERSCKAMTDRIIKQHCQWFIKKWQTQEKKKQQEQLLTVSETSSVKKGKNPIPTK